jgi:hypothetical protein
MTLDYDSLDTLRRIKLAETYWVRRLHRTYLECFKEAFSVARKPLVLVKPAAAD